jgi:seryl-tRNA(Sec) selenium transferase
VTCSTAAARLRGADVPVVCRVSDEAVVLDCRTIREEEVDEVARAVGELT